MEPAGWALTAAVGLDACVGDPPWWVHPVRRIGALAVWGEGRLRRSVRSESLAGWLLVIGVIGVVWGAVSGSRWLAARIHPACFWSLEVIWLYWAVSARDLAAESWTVFRALQSGDLALARKQVGRIVGRDTEAMDEPEVVRATLETIGESVMDGIVSPLFYAAWGGAPLAWVYKAVNTLDSMVGYRSARYLRFGAAAARVDRWMNWVPARLSAGLLGCAGGLAGFSWRGFRTAVRDAGPAGENSFWPEAAVAGALGVRLGGVNRYAGMPVTTPWMGGPGGVLAAAQIPRAIRLIWFSVPLTLGLALGIQAVLPWR
ncbi:MAG: cobalamin biosynthesis protein CobD [Candidatus Omnitrophica bacterium CG11_big_fil_rev_8_21_14_0_20_64_10]|nr:MAG: cobalamin biosynthesis protein CobD [Candidatus Omnitrophica bacterium CG11_big_fil_rev_8_21_14_0_20_64_10]